jgi:succinate-semialdehyde dehydrogenase/glutarate-semialdehyde dehydrogenase
LIQVKSRRRTFISIARYADRIFQVAEARKLGIVDINGGLIPAVATSSEEHGAIWHSDKGAKNGTEEFLEIKYPALGGLSK